MRKRTRLSPHVRGNATSVLALQRKPLLDRKTALRSKIRDILSGRSRFVIRKVGPAKGRVLSRGGQATSKGQERGDDLSSVSTGKEEVKKDRYMCPLLFPVPIWYTSHLLIPSSYGGMCCFSAKPPSPPFPVLLQD